MRIVVCAKVALDVSQIKVDASTQTPVLSGAPLKVSDFDKNAIEEAIRIREALGGEVFSVTVGRPESKAIREILAMGVDAAYVVSDQSLKEMDALVTSKVLAAAIKEMGSFDLVLCGESSIDGFTSQVGPRLAELLGIPQLTYARKVSVEGNEVVVERALEEEVEVVKAPLPALVTVTREVNVPRIPTIMDIMKASKKPITQWSLSDLGISPEELKPAVAVEKLQAPKIERKGVILEGLKPEEAAEAIVEALLKEGILRG